MAQEDLHAAAEQAVTEGRRTGYDHHTVRRAAIEALLKARPDSRRMEAENLIDDVMALPSPPSDLSETAGTVLGMTAALSVIALLPAIPLALVIGAFSISLGRIDGLDLLFTVLLTAFPISLVAWPLVAWRYLRHGYPTATLTLCAIPYLHLGLLGLCLLLA